jgi:hypothetical protein
MRSSSSLLDLHALPRPRSGSRQRTLQEHDDGRGESGSRMQVRTRESSAPLTSKIGFSVVAPMSRMSPRSTKAGRRPAGPC